MFSYFGFARWSRQWRLALAAAGACLGCNAIFNIDDPERAPESCLLNSDCPAGSGQVCVFTRCSPPCNGDVDCPANQRCLQTELGTACVRQDQARCDEADARLSCPSGTVCAEGACYGACSETERCSDGRSCEEGVCKGAPDAGPDNGAGAGGMPGGGGVGGAPAAGGGNGGDGGDGGAPVVPEEVCGDGEIGEAEDCDDGDQDAGDGCDASCTREPGWTCEASTPSQCAAICGDGLVLGEQAEAGGCDDGELEPGDGCSATCTVEPSFACSGQPSSCARTCGDSQLDDGEGCDDGNSQIGDGCASCAVESGFACDTSQTPTTCEDVNECDAGTDDCHANANCTNTTGAFNCSCKPGFTGNGKQCADVNECATDHDCHEYAVCTNTPGSYTCACKGGLTGNGKTTCSFGQLVGGLDGRLVTLPCSDTPSGDDCASAGAVSNGMTTACVGGNLTAVYDHPIAGPAGAEYRATLHYYGILEPKNYGPDVMREALQQPGGRGNPSLPAPFAISAAGAPYRTSDYNTAEVRVFDQTGTEVGSYFLNSDTTEGHYTFAINYERPIRVVGGGFVRLKIFDDNCRIIKNCGGNGGAPCAGKARNIDISAARPQPAGLVQPGLGQPAEHSGQWLHIDVTEVVPL